MGFGVWVWGSTFSKQVVWVGVSGSELAEHLCARAADSLSRKDAPKLESWFDGSPFDGVAASRTFWFIRHQHPLPARHAQTVTSVATGSCVFQHIATDLYWQEVRQYSVY